MLNENFVILGVVLNFIGGLTYLIKTIKGRVKPNKVTWLLWTIIPFIGMIAQIKQGVGIQALMTFMLGFNPLLIFIASFLNKKAYWKISLLDITCGILSIFGILTWVITKNGDTAILFSILADFLAALPTITKAYSEPETEDFMIFLLSTVSAIITLLTINTWNLAYLGWPLYTIGLNLFLTILIQFKFGKILSSK